MTFIMKNEMPVTLGDGRVITHTVVFWEMDYYKKIFHNDAYGEENSIFIRGNDGVNIYTESQKYNFSILLPNFYKKLKKLFWILLENNSIFAMFISAYLTEFISFAPRLFSSELE